MGLDYAYEIIASSRGVDDLLRSFGKAIVGGGGEYLSAARYDVVFELPLDDELEAYFSHTARPVSPPGTAHIGCVYVDFGVGTWSARLVLGAAGSTMSRLFWTPSIEQHVIAIAKRARAHAVFFDYEDDAKWNAVYPRRVLDLPRPKIRRPSTGEDIDAHADEALKTLAAARR